MPGRLQKIRLGILPANTEGPAPPAAAPLFAAPQPKRRATVAMNATGSAMDRHASPSPGKAASGQTRGACSDTPDHPMGEPRTRNSALR